MIQEFAETIIDNLPDALYAINTDGEIVFWNKSMEKLTGVKKDDVIGKGNYEYSYIFYGERVPGLVDTLLDKTGEIEKSFKNFSRDGNSVSGEKHIKNTSKILQGWATVLYEKDGNKIIGEVVIVKDVTLTKETEMNFSKIFDESPEPMTITEFDSGIILKVNKAFINFTGRTLEQLNERKFKSFECINNYTRPEILNILDKNKKIENLEITIIKDNGDISYGLLSSSIVSINEVKCVITIIKDITKQKKLELYLNKIKKDSEHKINEYLKHQHEKFDNVMLKHEQEIKEALDISSNIIKNLTFNGEK